MKKFMSILLAGACALPLVFSNTAVNVQAAEEPLELTMYFPVSVGGGPDALIDALCEQYHEENPNVIVNPVYAGSYAETRKEC